jgi:hypothetical protein
MDKADQFGNPETCWHYKAGRWERGPVPAAWVAEKRPSRSSPWEGYSRSAELGEMAAPLSFAVDDYDGAAERWVFLLSTPARAYFVVVEGLPDFLELLERLTATVNRIQRIEAETVAAAERPWTPPLE